MVDFIKSGRLDCIYCLRGVLHDYCLAFKPLINPEVIKVPSIFDYVTRNIDGTLSVNAGMTNTSVPVQPGVLVLTDFNGSPLVTVNPVANTYSLHNGAKLKDDWVETEGAITPTFPEFPSASVESIPTIHASSNCYDILEVENRKMVTVKYRDTIYTTRPKVKVKRFTLGEKYIEFRENGEIHVKGFKPIYPWSRPKAVIPIDLTTVKREGRSFNKFCHLINNDSLSRFMGSELYHHYIEVK